METCIASCYAVSVRKEQEGVTPPTKAQVAEGTYDWGGGGGTNDGAYVSTHALGGSGGMLSQKNF